MFNGKREPSSPTWSSTRSSRPWTRCVP